jgi:hypothetical protein
MEYVERFDRLTLARFFAEPPSDFDKRRLLITLITNRPLDMTVIRTQSKNVPLTRLESSFRSVSKISPKLQRILADTQGILRTPEDHDFSKFRQEFDL